eukprot:TRINITY_DN4558_c0_g2_i4.p1 TRINITY_DN4558_c0_g2~~TRINITY_DN4558_c0_g2_i4.p1  ORF type:complete len:317 (+),score=60.37 TRINITY_DN4558_c0_g2_i4:87-1037(+)
MCIRDRFGYVEQIWLKANRDAGPEVDIDELQDMLDKPGFDDPFGIQSTLLSQWASYKGAYGVTLKSFKTFFFNQARVDPQGVSAWVDMYADAFRFTEKRPGVARYKQYITENEFVHFYNRQARTRRKFEKWKAGLKMDLLTEELEQLKATPTISARSRWIAKDTKPLSQRVYDVIKDHDVLMRNVAEAARVSEQEKGEHMRDQRPPLSHQEAESVAKGLMQRGKELHHRREAAIRAHTRAEMASVMSQPVICERSRALASARDTGSGSAFDRLSRYECVLWQHDVLHSSHTAASKHKQSPIKHKPVRVRPASARGE